VLTSQPASNVTVTPTPNGQVSVSPTPLVFTSANWNVAQTVTVSAVDDRAVEGDHTGSITHTAASSDSNYNGIGIAGVTVSIVDNDTDTTPPKIELMELVQGIGTRVRAIVLNFNEPLDAARLPADLANYTLALNGRSVRIVSAAYDSDTATVTLIPSQRFTKKQLAKVTLTVVGSGSIMDIAGNLLDGDENGVAGGNYVRLLSEGTRR